MPARNASGDRGPSLSSSVSECPDERCPRAAAGESPVQRCSRRTQAGEKTLRLCLAGTLCALHRGARGSAQEEARTEGFATTHATQHLLKMFSFPLLQDSRPRKTLHVKGVLNRILGTTKRLIVISKGDAIPWPDPALTQDITANVGRS